MPHKLTWPQIWIATQRLKEKAKEAERATSESSSGGRGSTMKVSPEQAMQMVARLHGVKPKK